MENRHISSKKRTTQENFQSVRRISEENKQPEKKKENSENKESEGGESRKGGSRKSKKKTRFNKHKKIRPSVFLTKQPLP